MADLMRVKFENPKLKQSEIANQMGLSSSTLQRYGNDINMLSPHRVNPNNSNTRTKKALNATLDNNSHRDHALKRSQMTSNDLKRHQASSTGEKVKTKNNLKDGSVQDDVEITDQVLDEIFYNNDI